MPTRERKQEYFTRMHEMMDEYKSCLIVGINNVGSNQMQKIRIALRGIATVLMGKNTMMRKCIGDYVSEHPGSAWDSVLPELRGNVGFIFTNEALSKIRAVIDDNRVPAAAKAGAMAEVDVWIQPGPTGCDPGQTSWFQALNVPTKISRGQIEIITPLKLVTTGERVGASEAALLQKLDVRPFTFGMQLKSVYDNGSVFAAAVLDITPEALQQKFLWAVRRVAALSLATGSPTLASLPHSIGNAVKRLIAVAVSVDYELEAAAPWNALLNMDPEELAKMAAAASSGGGAAKEEEKEEEEEEEEEVDVGGGDLFGGGEADGY